ARSRHDPSLDHGSGRGAPDHRRADASRSLRDDVPDPSRGRRERVRGLPGRRRRSARRPVAPGARARRRRAAQPHRLDRGRRGGPRSSPPPLPLDPDSPGTTQGKRRMSFDESRLNASLRSVFGAVPAYRRERLVGDASTRSYHRLSIEGAPSLMVMDLPEDFLGSDEGTSGGRPTELPFVEVQRLCGSKGLPVPRVEAIDLASRILLLEDLGDRTFESVVSAADEAELERRYEGAVDLMVRMHEALYPPPAG